MQLVKEVRRLEIEEGIKKGDILELENVLSCDKQVVKIIEINNEGLKVIKLQNGQTEVYTYGGLMNYEARKMKIVYDTDKSILSQTAQPFNTDPKSHKANNDEYAEYLFNLIKDEFRKSNKLNRCLWKRDFIVIQKRGEIMSKKKDRYVITVEYQDIDGFNHNDLKEILSIGLDNMKDYDDVEFTKIEYIDTQEV